MFSYIYFALISSILICLEGIEHPLEQGLRKVGLHREEAPGLALKHCLPGLLDGGVRPEDDHVLLARVRQVRQEPAGQVAELAADVDRAEVVEVRLVDVVQRRPEQ